MSLYSNQSNKTDINSCHFYWTNWAWLLWVVKLLFAPPPIKIAYRVKLLPELVLWIPLQTRAMVSQSFWIISQFFFLLQITNHAQLHLCCLHHSSINKPNVNLYDFNSVLCTTFESSTSPKQQTLLKCRAVIFTKWNTFRCPVRLIKLIFVFVFFHSNQISSICCGRLLLDQTHHSIKAKSFPTKEKTSKPTYQQYASPLLRCCYWHPS